MLRVSSIFCHDFSLAEADAYHFSASSPHQTLPVFLCIHFNIITSIIILAYYLKNMITSQKEII